jgi:hypothetical protein
LRLLSLRETLKGSKAVTCGPKEDSVATPKEIRRRGRFLLAFGTVIAAALFVVGAAADDISNDLPGTVKVMALNAGGPTGSTVLTVIPKNGDGKNGCNFQGATSSLVVSVASSDASVATVSPTSLTFGSCGDVKTLTVTPHDAGSANVTLAQVSNSTGGSFNLAPAAFRVDVAPPPNTAPNVTVTGVTHGAEYAKGSVPAAGCSVVDAEDGNSTFPAALSPITGAYASDGLGNQTATCSYTDGGGLTETVTATYSIYDPSAPGIGYTLAPASPNGNNGWYRSDVSLTWNVSEPESPNSLSKTGCVDQNVIADQAETTYSCSATSAGGAAGPVSVSIKRDATSPTIGGSASPAANGHGWNNTAVDVSFLCDDNLSGVASCGPNATLASEGRDQSVTGNASDNAGNTNSATVGGINIDKSSPNAPSVSADRASDYAGGGGWYKNTVTLSFAGAGDPDLANGDLGSGVDPASIPLAQTFSSSGPHTASGTVKDLAGNESAARSMTVQVDATKPAVSINCPSSPIILGSSATASWTATDAHSGLATAASGTVALDTTSVGSKTATAPTATDHVGLDSDPTSCSYSVVFDWNGFFQPVDNKDANGSYILNKAKAGSTVPVKFSLAGDQGLGIFASGFPQTAPITCAASSSDAIEEYATGTVSGLKYDAVADQYIYNWKTESKWAGTCRQLIVKLSDGTYHRANFNFFK